MTRTRPPMVWVSTATGSALHRPTCDSVPDVGTADGVVTHDRRDAAAWLAAGDRRFLCRTCRPADPRMAVVA